MGILMQLTHARLLERLTYDPATGFFHKKGNYRGRRKDGQRMGYQGRDQGRWIIRLDGRAYKASRLAWFYMTGEWPSQQIDHVNQDFTDNRFSNLREATRSQNTVNQSFQSRNKSGFRGVRKYRKRWIAEVTWMGRKEYLGTYETPEEAHNAYVKAAHLLHGAFLPQSEVRT